MRVVARKVSYSHAEDILLLSRCGRDYQRLEQAEAEAAQALSYHLTRMIPPPVRPQGTLRSPALTAPAAQR
jgi:hypothetical protein